MKGQEGSQIHNFFEELYEEINDTLYKFENEETTIIEKIKRSIGECKNARTRFLRFVQSMGFESQEEEICFFKEMKPKVESLLFYYNNLLRIELDRPFGNKKYEEAYYEKELQKIGQFFKDNNFLLQYHRGGSTFLDDKLFVRIDTDKGMWVPLYQPDTNYAFSSPCDYIIAEIMTNEMVWDYLTKGIKKLNEDGDKKQSQDVSHLKWTDSKVALIELLYALYRRGSINNGNVEIKEIAKFFETIFQIDLGNFYRTFQELRIRKTGRTNYLDDLKSVLVRYMDETDLNYKG